MLVSFFPICWPLSSPPYARKIVKPLHDIHILDKVGLQFPWFTSCYQTINLCTFYQSVLNNFSSLVCLIVYPVLSLRPWHIYCSYCYQVRYLVLSNKTWWLRHLNKTKLSCFGIKTPLICSLPLLFYVLVLYNFSYIIKRIYPKYNKCLIDGYFKIYIVNFTRVRVFVFLLF